MKIVKLQAENVKRLKAVQIEPQGNLVLIGGRNGAGKSSVLDSIWYALGGKDAAKGTPAPIRAGQARASVDLDLGDLKVRRTWTANDKSYLAVETAEGAKYGSPQAVLDGLVGRLAFDPLAFARQTPREQGEVLKALVCPEVDLDALQVERDRLYAERTAVNRQVKQREGALAVLPEPAPELPAGEIAEKPLLARLGVLQEEAKRNDARRAGLRALADAANRAQETADATTQQLAALQAQLTDEQAAAEAANAAYWDEAAEVEALVDPDTNQATAQLADAQEVNARIRAATEYRRVEADLVGVRDEAARLTAAIEERDALRARVLREAPYPIPGLGLSDEGVTYQGLPFGQCSSAEQLRVSVALAMALNPKLRVIRITDGSLLDSASLGVIAGLAEERDYQVWIEVVDETGSVGVTIEDGEVAGAAVQAGLPLEPIAPGEVYR